MAKSLSADYLTQIKAAAKKPVWLVEIQLEQGTIYFCSGKDDTTWNSGQTWTAKAMVVGPVQMLEDQPQTAQLRLDNVSGDMTAYVWYSQLTLCKLIIRRVFTDDHGDNDFELVFDGWINSAGLDDTWLAIRASEDKGIARKWTGRKFSQLCGWRFGGTECNADGYADLTDVAIAPMKRTGTLNAADAAGCSSTQLTDSQIVDINGYWNEGIIEITIASIGKTLTRTVYSFTASSDKIIWQLPLQTDAGAAVTPAENDTWTLYKGCTKLYNTCAHNTASGPSADNKANFGGFLAVPIETESSGVD